MVDFGAVSSALRVSWDAPYRLAASLIGMLALAGDIAGQTPLQELEAVIEWAGVGGAHLRGITAVEMWISDRGELLTPGCGVVALIALLLVGRRDTRAAATAVLAAAACAQSGGPAMYALYVLAFVLWAVPAVIQVTLERTGRRSAEHYGLQHRPAMWLSGLISATFYFPLVFLRWIFSDERGALHLG